MYQDYNLSGVIQPIFHKDLETTKAPVFIDRKEKIVEQDIKSDIYLDCIPKSFGIDDGEIYSHCFHTLLLHDNDSLQSITNLVVSSLHKDHISAIDITRIQLQVASLCTVSDDGLLLLKESLIEDINLSSWCWSTGEREKIQSRLKQSLKREAAETVVTKKRARKNKQVQEGFLSGIVCT